LDADAGSSGSAEAQRGNLMLVAKDGTRLSTLLASGPLRGRKVVVGSLVC